MWLDRPRGPLPPVPALLARTGSGPEWASTRLRPTRSRTGSGTRIWPTLRSGCCGRGSPTGRIEAHLRAEFELSCAPLPPAKPGYFEALAKWAVESQIADRERACEALAEFIRKRNQGGRK